jgi:hypothetical protein
VEANFLQLPVFFLVRSIPIADRTAALTAAARPWRRSDRCSLLAPAFFLLVINMVYGWTPAIIDATTRRAGPHVHPWSTGVTASRPWTWANSRRRSVIASYRVVLTVMVHMSKKKVNYETWPHALFAGLPLPQGNALRLQPFNRFCRACLMNVPMVESPS